MKYAVRYYTKTGNTKKLALEAASALGVEALTTQAPLSEKVDTLFLASSVYGAGVDNEVIQFLISNKANIGEIVNISSAALLPSTFKQIKKIADENGIKMCEEEYHCRGSFAMMHKNHPNEEDLANLRTFIKKVAK